LCPHGAGQAQAIESINLDPYEVAYLANGAALAVNGGLAKLIHGNVVAVTSNGKFSAPDKLPAEAHPVEQAVYNAVRDKADITVREIHKAATPATHSIGDRFQEQGLVVAESHALMARAVPILLLLMLAALLRQPRRLVLGMGCGWGSRLLTISLGRG
jgi:uncharacterized protein (TIGR04222 family)